MRIRTFSMSDPKSPPWPVQPLGENPSLRLIDYTISNLDGFMNTDVLDPGSLMTQWLNSLAGIMAIAVEPLLDDEKLKLIPLEDEVLQEWSFPSIRFIEHRSDHVKSFPNLWRFKEFLRNALAHGNVEFVPGNWVTKQDGERTDILLGASFVGVAIWNQPHKRSKSRTKTIILDFTDIGKLVYGWRNLCHDKSLWCESALKWSAEEVESRFGQMPARLDLVIVPSRAE